MLFYALKLQEWNTGKFKPRPWPAFQTSQPYFKCRRSTHLKVGKTVCHCSGSCCLHLYLNFTSLVHRCRTNLFVLLVIFIVDIQFSISFPVIAFLWMGTICVIQNVFTYPSQILFQSGRHVLKLVSGLHLEVEGQEMNI